MRTYFIKWVMVDRLNRALCKEQYRILDAESVHQALEQIRYDNNWCDQTCSWTHIQMIEEVPRQMSREH